MRTLTETIQSRSYLGWPQIVLAIVTVILGISVGILQVQIPFLGPGVLLGLVMAPVFLVLGIRYQVIAILAVLLGSRLLVLFGAPSSISYAFYGLILLFLGRLLFDQSVFRSYASKISTRIYLFSFFLLTVTVVSALLNGWHALRPVMLFILLASPFIVFASVRDLQPHEREHIRTVLLALLAFQVPFAIGQTLMYGTGDHVQGTLIGQGAGAHIVGAICIIGAVGVLLERDDARGSRLLLVLLSALLMSVSVLADAKQVIAAVAVAFALMILPLIRASLFPVLATLAVMIPIGILTVQLNPYMGQLVNPEKVIPVIEKKFTHIPFIIGQMDSLETVLGLGPGSGTSRVAELTLPEYGNAPAFIVGSTQAQLAADLTVLDAQLVGQWGSSTSAPFFSAMSVFTDLGLVGCVVYALLGWQVWRSFSSHSRLNRTLARSMMLTAVVLAGISTWLEEPVYMIVLAAMLGSISTTSDGGDGAKRRGVIQQNVRGHATIQRNSRSVL